MEQDPSGRPLRQYGVMLDVTERKRAEEVLDEQAALLDLAHDAILVRGAGDRITFWNRGAEETYGWKREEAVGQPAADLLRTRYPRPLVEIEAAVRESGRWEGELTHVRKDGGEIVVASRWAAQRDPAGRQVGVLEISRDVTDRARAERALRDSEKLYRAIGESIDFGVWVCAPDGRNTYASESFLKLVGLTQEQCSNFGWGDVLHPDDAERTIAAWKECVRTGAKWDIEHRFRGVDGEWHPVLARGVAVRDERGAVVCWAGINLDISDLKRAENDLREADRRKDEFLAVLSHELRNPLAPIRNSVAILERAPSGSPQASRAMDVIRRQAEHLTRLVDDLLDVTRISRGKIDLHRECLDLREVVRRGCDDHHSVFDGGQVALRLDVPAEPVWVDADATRISQVIGNLLQNACKFTPPGGTTTVGLRAREGRAEVWVRDSGIGMEPGILKRMFEPFVQAESGLARSRGGLGLGLALAKGLVELQGGTIEARSDGPGRGSCFVVTLPLAPPPGPAERGGRAGPGAAGRLVLVIDDHADAGQTLAALLELGGHRVHLARTGRAGIELARQLRPDAVVCDIGLPDLDGYAVARALRGEEALRSTRLVALSGYARPEDRRRAADAGFDTHVAKPPDPDELMKAIDGDA